MKYLLKRNFKKFSIIVILIVFISIGVLAENKLEVFKMPSDKLDGNNTVPSIAANKYGDIMVVFRNRYKGMMYYFKKHDSNNWVGPKEIPDEPYPVNVISGIDFSSMTVTSNGNFHLFWSVRKPGYGGYYCYFDVSKNSWSKPIKVKSGDLEWPKIFTNPTNDDLIFLYVQNVSGVGKDPCFFVKKKDGTWIKPVNVAEFGVPGKASAADASGCFDEEGNLYFVYRTKSIYYEGKRKIGIALFNREYKLDQRGEFTKGNLDGDLFLPSIGMYKGEGYVAFERNGAQYYGIPIKIKYYDDPNKKNYLDFNKDDFHPLAPSPGWYDYHSRILVHGDELLFIYKNENRAIKMLRYDFKTKEWLDDYKNPIDLSSDMPSHFVYNVFSDRKIGILAAWFTREEPTKVYFSIYHYPKYSIKSAIIESVERIYERSFFSSYFANKIIWKDNPENLENNIQIKEYRIYRRVPGEEYMPIATVEAGNYSYIDVLNISSPDENKFEYYVTTVDIDGNESEVEEDE